MTINFFQKIVDLVVVMVYNKVYGESLPYKWEALISGVEGFFHSIFMNTEIEK